jgi:phosphoglycerate kinase
MRSVVARTSQGAVSIIGGGDTGSLVHNMGLEKKVSYVSTGGGATL